MATVVYLVFDPSSGLIRYSNAGHLPPLVVASDGSTAFLEGGRAAPLGSESVKGHPVAEMVLDEGGTIILYTDGLVEEKGKSIDDGLRDLVRLATTHGDRGVESLLDAIMRSRLSEKAPDDDVALLGLRHGPFCRITSG